MYSEVIAVTRMEQKVAGHLSAQGIQAEPQVWVGNVCLDFLLPKYNLAIEVNGPIHYKEFKMSKDRRKLDVLSKLGIWLLPISNEDVSEFDFALMATKLRRRANIRPFAKTMYAIKLFTVLKHKNYLIRTLQLDPRTENLLHRLGILNDIKANRLKYYERSE